MKFLYVLPRYDYFKKGRNGSVTHAEGIGTGLYENDVELDVLSGPNSREFMKNANQCFLNDDKASVIWFFNFIYFLLKTSVSKNYDVIIVRFSTKYSLIISLIFKMFRVKRWGFELNSFNYTNIRRPILKSLVKKYEYLSLKQACFINSVSDSLTNEAKLINKNSFTLPNAGPRLTKRIIDSNRCSGFNDTLNIVYMGAIRDYFDLTMVVNVCKEVDNVHLHIFGKNGLLSSVETKELNQPNCTYYGEYLLDSVFENEVFKKPFFFILPYKSGTVAEIGSPTKMFEYLSMGAPIISSKVGQPFSILSKANNDIGDFSFFYDSPEQLKVLLEKLKIIEADFSSNDIISYYERNHTWSVRCSEYMKNIELLGM